MCVKELLIEIIEAAARNEHRFKKNFSETISNLIDMVKTANDGLLPSKCKQQIVPRIFFNKFFCCLHVFTIFKETQLIVFL